MVLLSGVNVSFYSKVPTAQSHSVSNSTMCMYVLLITAVPSSHPNPEIALLINFSVCVYIHYVSVCTERVIAEKILS